MPKFEKGDLVMAFRRKNPGLGIVLDYVKDFDAEVGLEGANILQQYFEIEPFDFPKREDLLEETYDNCRTPREVELAKTFFTYNRGWKHKLKNEFVYIHWFQPPSNYYNLTNKQAQGKKEWYPAEWLRKTKEQTKPS